MSGTNATVETFELILEGSTYTGPIPNATAFMPGRYLILSTNVHDSCDLVAGEDFPFPDDAPVKLIGQALESLKPRTKWRTMSPFGECVRENQITGKEFLATLYPYYQASDDNSELILLGDGGHILTITLEPHDYIRWGEVAKTLNTQGIAGGDWREVDLGYMLDEL